MITCNSNTKNIHAKRALKVLSVISSYVFEEDCFLNNKENESLKQANETLSKIINKNK